MIALKRFTHINEISYLSNSVVFGKLTIADVFVSTERMDSSTVSNTDDIEFLCSDVGKAIRYYLVGSLVIVCNAYVKHF